MRWPLRRRWSPQRPKRHRDRRGLAAVVAALALGGVGCASLGGEGRPLRVASWNLEHLAEDGGRGCRVRTEADYAGLRDLVRRLDADVVAFQEVESAAAAARVFDPAVYAIVIERRPASGPPSPCRGLEGRTLTHQAVGFAIRRTLRFERAPDFTDLQVGDANLRAGVDITVRQGRRPPMRLLAVHLKSGCATGDDRDACRVLERQIPVLERWIDARAAEPVRFAVLGDFNRRLALARDTVWAELDDGDPANSDLTLAAGTRRPTCDPRYDAFIDHVVLDRRAAADLVKFEEQTFGDGPRLSDHCPVVVQLR